MPANYTFVIDWQPADGSYRLWSFDPDGSDPLAHPPLHQGTWSQRTGHQLVPIGNYVLDWDHEGGYQLLSFDPQQQDPLAGEPVQSGHWRTVGSGHQLVSVANYVLDWEPTHGRYRLWQFDPQSNDPLPGPEVQRGGWEFIRHEHRLVPIGNYVLDWHPTEPGQARYRLWQFDPQSGDPLPAPEVQRGTWTTIDAGHQLVPIGDYVLDWVPAQGQYRLWRFDPQSTNPLTGPVQQGTWETIGSGHTLLGVQPVVARSSLPRNPSPGTLDFMRDKIEHVVYYMLENRSFDHLCGWLYENDVPHVIGRDASAFHGASTDDFNNNRQGQPVHLSKYESPRLDLPTIDPHHDYLDVMQQLYDGSNASYAGGDPPPMSGFVLDNDSDQVMETYTPDHLRILNGLARDYAVSDQWFCSMPGPTDVNRAFSVTGSSYGRTRNFEGHLDYPRWPDTPHRSSMWKVLWDNGIQDWKIYYQDLWLDHCYTYHLFLKGLIPSVDAHQDRYVCPYQQFESDVRNNSLPRFSYIEPAWLGVPNHPPNSYHPPSDLMSGEIFLNNLYNTLMNSELWEKTLLIITFDEHGGIYDHVSTPRGARPYAGDESQGFSFDLFGVRVPTLLVSPWVEQRTVFRSMTSVPYDATSMPATVLSWCGIPRAKWGLGERINQAPTFESALTRSTARRDKPTLNPPNEGAYPDLKDVPLNDLHRLFVPRFIQHLGRDKVDHQELRQLTEDVLSRARNIQELHDLLLRLPEKLGR